MSITRKNLAGKVSQTSAGKGHVDAGGVIYLEATMPQKATWEKSFPRCPSPGRIWREI
jgi:hypothetical protein